MKQFVYRLGITLALVIGFSVSAVGDDVPFVEDEAVCEAHGTSVQFFETPAEAAKKALKEEKLVFVLHVSGNFETPDFT